MIFIKRFYICVGMKKSLLLFIISGVLSLSILAPSVCTLLEISVETSLVKESDEESKKEKSEKELEEKQWNTHKTTNSLLAILQQNTNNFAAHTADPGIDPAEVTSPPPERMTRT